MNLERRQWLAARLRKVADEEAARGAADFADVFRRQADDVLAGVSYSNSWAREAKRSSPRGSILSGSDTATLSRNPEHWLARAKEARAVVATIKDAADARAVLDIAESYEKIAKRAEAREIGGIAVQLNKE
jgi:hypothetical protein